MMKIEIHISVIPDWSCLFKTYWKTTIALCLSNKDITTPNYWIQQQFQIF